MAEVTVTIVHRWSCDCGQEGWAVSEEEQLLAQSKHWIEKHAQSRHPLQPGAPALLASWVDHAALLHAPLVAR